MTLTHFNGNDGVRLAADCYRHPDSPAVVLLLHGGGQNRQAWAATAHQLHEAGYTVIAYDARGHGDSAWDPTGHYDLDVLASDLLAVRAQASSDRPVAVVGASLGGMTVLGAHRLAAADLWAAVILVDITPRIEFDGARRVVSFMAAHPDGFGSLDEAAESIAEYNPHRARPRSLNGLRKVLRQREDNRWIWRWDPAFVTSNFHFLRGDPAAGAEEFNAITDLLVDGARRVRAPTLLVRGVLSDVTSQQSVDEFLQVVPHAQTVDVSGTAHMVAGDDNDAFTAAVADFLDRTIAAKS
ncbi:putative hydrolase (alpha/beta fold) [Mycobacterium saskatchewanense]|uniref:Alpha/beta hydrolase fold family protein n=4 Tax=Mycobacterium TaxID=1763 RepID=X8CJ33_MYCIT|nr:MULTISPECIES: alpha/beta hydrolase [Mycobacterium]EUA31597.1 alpha/beta hydrolase fold family protein [Mycobacterium intracellulare]EUA55816.1 alpha/beta hydrolase fold family protein [Mycobacterium intracellulare 1956]MBY0391180.1 alpha/beta hydrolase [Mycobacterium pseudokansasii]ORV60955.1 alpha/beta hydrolase [Mycobacterium europaeum]ORW69876.1 alpha/beta hydrolase [Mycobacterium saskatchewanense]